jgi:hypothetical protein
MGKTMEVNTARGEPPARFDSDAPSAPISGSQCNQEK